MRIYDNGIYRDMTAEEIAEFQKIQQPYHDENKDNLTTLAEGLSTATNIKDVQKAAKKILESEKI